MSRHTRYAKLARKGWLSMECNVEDEQARRHSDDDLLRSHEEDSVWVPNAVAAAAPELLEIARRALNESARVRPDFAAEIRDVIAKATP